MTFGRHSIAVAVCLPLLALAACSEDPEPIIPPPEETTAAADPTPTPEPKEPWEKQTDAGAVAFAKHWIDVFNEAQRTGDVEALRALSGDGCGSCDGFAEQLEDLYAGGGELESRGWRVVQAVSADDLPKGDARVSLRVARMAQVIRYGDERPPERFPASRVTLSARMKWIDGGWRMNDLVAPL